MEEYQPPKPYKQRFKGVENFLRRIAFNLGNSPSQTEVKVISCIPIDVTDLQQKIVHLEKQLFEAQNQLALHEDHSEEPSPPEGKENDKEKNDNSQEKPPDNKKPGPTTVVNTAFVKQSSALTYYSKQPTGKIKMQPGYCEVSSDRERKSNVSFVFPTTSAAASSPSCGCRNKHNNEAGEDCKGNIETDPYRNIFRRRKKKKVIGTKSKIKTQFIYYAQESPKNPFNLQDNILLTNQNGTQISQLSRSYLNNVLRRQYDPKVALEEFSDTSHFSKPICRDMKYNLSHPHLYESDVSSCCRGKFQNLDSFITNYFTLDAINTNAFEHNHHDKMYYDSNFYDVIPVKDNGNVHRKPHFLYKKEHKRHSDMKCWPEKQRNRSKYHTFLTKHRNEIPGVVQSPKRELDEFDLKQERVKKHGKRRSFQYSKSCSIECSNIYTKPENGAKIKLRKSEPTKKIWLKDEKVETDINATSNESNQATHPVLLPLEENRTESTLNQIKSILQSVLQEVKTNSNVNTEPEVPKKDVTVQKGSSQNNMENSLFNTFTSNNSCNTNMYLPSCSRQMSQGQYYFPGMPYQPTKYLQNFPVFVHPATRKPMCGCYYKQSSHKTSHNKQATTTATNTEKNIKKTSSHETEKLIKEIYKSMTLNMDYPTKENSLSDYEDLKSRVNSFHETHKENKNNQSDDLTTRDIEIEAILPPLIANTNGRKYVYTATSTHSQNNRMGSEVTPGYTAAGYMNRTKLDVVDKQSNGTIDEVDDETEESSDDTDTEETMILSEIKQNKSEKRSFIKRMLNSVKLFKKGKDIQDQRNDSDIEVTEVSDSDECRTTSSIRTGRGRKHERFPNTRKQYSKDRTRIEQKTDYHRMPYLEQEYRRQWNENLMFYNQHERSRRPFFQPSTSQPSPPPFWNSYEARSAFVERDISNPNEKIEQGTSSPTCMADDDEKKSKLPWIKKRKLGINCGERWKKYILEN